MTAPAVHRVRRLSWQVRADTPAQAFALRSRLQAQTDALPALLERVLDDVAVAHDPPEVVWKIPRLTLQLDLARADLHDAELRPLLEQALRQALASALDAASTASSAASSDAAAGASTATGVTAALTHRSTTQAGTRAAFDHYLRHGHLPWPEQALPPEQQLALLRSAAQAVLAQLRAAGAGEAARRALLALLPAAESARRGALARWLALLTPVQSRTMVETVLGAPAREDAAGTQPDTPDARLQAILEAIETAADGPGRTAPAVARHVPAPRTATSAQAAAPAAAAPHAAGLQAPLPPRADHTAAARGAATGAMPHRPGPGLAGPVSSDAAAQLVPLAGLVLLHPYLPRLLQGRGLIGERDRDIGDTTLPRACALVHALAAGEAPAQEYALPFVKLLLGRAPDAPLVTALPAPDEADLAESAALLQAVRAHWPAMAGTGDDALRVSFLQRRGLLSHTDGAWQLRMAREPFDLLLGLLPWGIGLVRTPWMRVPLTVEWPAA